MIFLNVLMPLLYKPKVLSEFLICISCDEVIFITVHTLKISLLGTEEFIFANIWLSGSCYFRH